MYSPYLYARASELLALRALIKNKVDLQHLIPIIEPVVLNSERVQRCMREFGEAKASLIVVINPAQHEFHESSEAQINFRTETIDLFNAHKSLIPGYIVNSQSTKKKIERFFSFYPDRPVALLYNSSPLSQDEFKSIVSNKNIIHHISINERISSMQVSLIPKSKFIEVRDNFNKLKKNADYDGAEFFTDRHKEVGDTLQGVGDYTITGRSLEIGGGRPGAVAIHATYEKKNSDIWVEHFVSDETDRDMGDASSKFLEAARKLVAAISKRPGEFGNDAVLQAYKDHVANDTFPGLPKNKEYQIYHHICLMLKALPNTK